MMPSADTGVVVINHEERAITEINAGIYLVSAAHLKKWLPQITNHNQQQEYYLTDIINLALKDHVAIHAVQPVCPEEIFGINDRHQLAHLERFHQIKCANQLMQQGVTMYDPTRFELRGNATIGQDVIIDINVILEGNVAIGNNCNIGAHCIIKNTIIKDNVTIRPYSLIDGATIDEYCVIGPFARIRPDTMLSAHAHIGNFVEIKNSMINAHSKINHLSYIGDSTIGKHVNIGAGTITCNYDGVNKHQTIIKDHAFVGSNSQLVAPITIGTGATIGAGSTITRDAPDHQLTLSRAAQRSIANWQRQKKPPQDTK